jgi:protein-tyrosine-phosphatase
VRAVLSSLRHRPDRWLHPVRHRRAMAIVRERLRGTDRRVLVVCYGNICRSPYAAAVIRRVLAPLGVKVDSAGIVGAGRPIPSHAHASAMRRGEDLSAHRSQLLSPRLVRGAALVIVMDAAQRDLVLARYVVDPASVVLLGDLDPTPILKRAIRDPYDQSPEVFEEVFARIDRCGEAIARALGERASARVPSFQAAQLGT